MLMSHCQNERQTCNIKVANIPFENVAKFKYLGTAETDQSLIYEETKTRSNSGNA
jgi:hypothetical protein